MIIFQGNISSKIVQRQLRRVNHYVAILGLIACFAIEILVGLLLLTEVFTMDVAKDLFILGGLVAVLGMVVFFLPSFKVNEQRGKYVTVEIESDWLRCDRPYHGAPYVTMPVKDVKRVLDYGECYYIIYTDMGQAIICQKDLLREGTLEEFEEIFAGKIKRRGKAKKQCKAEQKAERKK